MALAVEEDDDDQPGSGWCEVCLPLPGDGTKLYPALTALLSRVT